MKTKKRRTEPFSFYDHTGIEKHLTKMAQQGWMIERITNQYWTYRRIEPQELHFSVTYYPKADDFAPEPSDKQQTFYDFCEKTGWEFACSWFQMQIFYNTSDDPVPLDTDPVYEVETIHKACRSSFLWAYKVLFVIGAVGTYFFYSALAGHTLYFFSNPSSMVTYPCLFFLLLLSAVDLTAYYSWHHKAVKLAKDGIFLDTPSTAAFQKALYVFGLGSVLGFWLVNLFFNQKPLMAVVYCLMFSVVFLTISFTNALKYYMKQKKMKAGRNRVLTIMAAFLIPFLLTGCILSLGRALAQNTSIADSVYIEEPPLTVEDLTETPYQNYLTMTSQDTSLLLHRLEVEQRQHFDDVPSEDIPSLEYQLYQVNIPTLYHFFEGQMKRIALLSSGKGAALMEADAALFCADHAYRLAAKDGTLLNRYILCYENQLVDIAFSWEITEEQMALVGKLCKPAHSCL